MKKKMIFGSILAIFLMMMLPSISATESEINIKNKKIQMYIEELQEQFLDDPPQPTIILRLLLWLRNLVIIIILAILFIIGSSSNKTLDFQ